MSKDNKRSYPGIQIGTSFMLIVFVILCLVVFATLSLSGSLRDYEYSRKAAQKTTDYYNACSSAEETIGEIDAVLQDAKRDAQSDEDYLKNAVENLSQLQGIEVESENETTTISFEEEINDTQKLLVSLKLEEEMSTDDGLYRIVTWKESPAKSWEEKTTLPVLGSDNDKTD